MPPFIRCVIRVCAGSFVFHAAPKWKLRWLVLTADGRLRYYRPAKPSRALKKELRARGAGSARIALVLGSGLGGFAEDLKGGGSVSSDELAVVHDPDDVVFVDELPHTATGKLLKAALREEYQDYKLPTAESA